MILFYLIINDFELDENYKCLNVNPSEQKLNRSPFLGIYFLTSGCLLLTLYSLCLKAMLSKELIKSPAYKIMISLAICDIFSVPVNSIVTGLFGYLGISYCEFPRFIFMCGALGFGAWLGCSSACVILALCRLSELNPQLKLDFLFRGIALKVLLIYIFLISVLGFLFTKPVIFRLEYMSWFFDPGLGLDPELYTNNYHTVNNMAQSVLTTFLYSVLCFTIFQKSHNSLTRTQKQFCYQAAVICFGHSVSSSVYVYMQFFPTPGWLIAAEQVGWQMCTGGICLVYLVFNKTIRTSVKKTLGLNILIPPHQSVSGISVTVSQLITTM